MVSRWMLRSTITCVATAVLIIAPFDAEAITGEDIDKERIKGITLRASLFEYPPFYKIKRHPRGNSSAEVEGLSFDLMQIITSFYGVSWHFVPMDSIRSTRDGSNDAIIHQLVNKEVDMAFYPFIRNLPNSQLIHISVTLASIERTLMQPWPLEESLLTAPVRPFSVMTWLVICGSMLVVVSAMALVSFAQSKWTIDKKTARYLHLPSFPDHFYSWVQYVVSIVTYQGYHLTYKPESLVRIVAGFWALMMVVLLNAYTGTLTSYLTVPKLEPIINSLEQLVIQTNMKLAIHVESGISQMFLGATSGVDKVIGDYLRENPELLIKSDFLKPIEFATRRIAVCLTSKDYARFMMMHDFKSTSKCRMTVSTDFKNTHVVHYGFGLPESSPYKSFLNDFLLKTCDFGIRDYLLSKYLPRDERCAFNTKSRGRVGSLYLHELSGIFALLGIGIGISFFAFLIEVVSYHISRRRRRLN